MTQMTQMTQTNQKTYACKNSGAPTLVDLFSGAGGTGIGFIKAGFRILGAVEIDRHAAETYEKNLGVKVKISDIRDFSPKKFRKELKLRRGELDVLVGCPPCQGFSRMRNGNGADDERNDLVMSYLEFVRELMPRFAVFENVPGLLRTKHGRKFYDQLYKGLKDLGYNVKQYEVDAADFGTPQHRKRVIVIAGRHGEEPPSLEKKHGNPNSKEVREGKLKPWVTVRDAIGKFPAVEAGENAEEGNKYPNHIAPAMGKKVREFIRQVPKDGGSRTDVSKELWLKCHKKHSGHVDVYGRVAWDRPSNTLTCGCTNVSKGRFVHPEQDRALTYREAAALQGFDLTVVFYGASFHNQIGNAVPPTLAFAIAQTLKKQIVGQKPRRKRYSKRVTGRARSAVRPDDRSNVKSPAVFRRRGRPRRTTERVIIPKAA
ncbi:MAG TPA: DNA cytosine methyltransferase [Pyrinomonadaceae bacterium]|jgi:DNA (cytosine-5)-methyltransferase 1